jgi:hypothetical protein
MSWRSLTARSGPPYQPGEEGTLMRHPGLAMLTLVLTAATLVSTSSRVAGAVVEPTGCCCIAGTGGQACMETTERECLAKQQAAPQYDSKTNYDSALQKSETQEAGKTKSGWREGKCETK